MSPTAKSMMTIMSARNGWTIRTRSGVYICKTIAELLDEVKSYALVLQKEAAQNATGEYEV